MQAVILAAGRGERLRPLTNTMPKPLIQIAGRAMIDYVLDALPDAVSEILIVVGYLGELIEKHIGDSWNGKPVRYVQQENGRVGTFAALSAVKEILNERFLILASDVCYKKEDLTKLLIYPLSILVRKEVGDGSRRIAQCVVEGGLLCGIDERAIPKGEVFANSSAYVLDERIFSEPVVRGKNGEEWLSTMTGNLAIRVPVRAVLATFHATVTTPYDISHVEEKIKNGKVIGIMQEKTYEVLAAVTARGGSKRIPRKSIVPLLGKPALVYVIEALKKAKRVTRLILDTDDPEMAQIGRKAGAEIPFMRPAHLATDTASHEAVLQYELDFLKEKEGYVPDAMVLVQPTSPLVAPEEINRCVELLFAENLDSAESIFEVPNQFNPFAQRVIDTDGYTHFLLEKERAKFKKTGLKPKTYTLGNVYCFRPLNLERYGTVQGKRSKSVVMERRNAIDIDEPFDIEIATAVLKSSV